MLIVLCVVDDYLKEKCLWNEIWVNTLIYILSCVVVIDFGKCYMLIY